MYFESLSASYLPIRPFSAADRKRPKSKASFRISAMLKSVPSRIALSRSRSVSDLSRPSSMLALSVSSSVCAISYFCSGVSLGGLSPKRCLMSFALAAVYSSVRRSCFCLRSRYDSNSWFSRLIYSLFFSIASSRCTSASTDMVCKSKFSLYSSYVGSDMIVSLALSYLI